MHKGELVLVLQVLVRSGTPSEKKYAKRIQPASLPISHAAKYLALVQKYSITMSHAS